MKPVDPRLEAFKDAKLKADKLFFDIVELFKEAPMEALSADAIANKLVKPVLTVRPHITRMAQIGILKDSGSRGKTVYGKSCKQYDFVPEKYTGFFPTNFM